MCQAIEADDSGIAAGVLIGNAFTDVPDLMSNILVARDGNSASAELAEGIAQVHKIAWMRMRTIVKPNPTGFLTCHVLDTARGCPAAGMAVSLHKLNEQSGAWELLGRYVTNSDGRTGPVLKGEAFTFGTYEWCFGVGDYFASAAVPTAGTQFLSDVPLRFGIDDPLPLMVELGSWASVVLQLLQGLQHHLACSHWPGRDQAPLPS